MKAVIYTRTANPRSETALETQVELCRIYAEENGIDIIGTYRDRGVPARTMTARDGLQRMICDSAKGDFEAVIVANLDRLVHDVSDYKSVRVALGANGVQIIPIQGTEEREIDLLIDAMLTEQS